MHRSLEEDLDPDYFDDPYLLDDLQAWEDEQVFQDEVAEGMDYEDYYHVLESESF